MVKTAIIAVIAAVLAALLIVHYWPGDERDVRNPTTQFAPRCSLDSYSSVCVKGTPDDFEAGSIEQAKWPFRYQMFSSARLLAAAA